MVFLVIRIFFRDAMQTRLLPIPSGGRHHQVFGSSIPVILAPAFCIPCGPSVPHPKKIDDTAAQGWTNRGSVRSSAVVVSILSNLVILTLYKIMYTSTRQVKGWDNNMVNSVSQLIHLSDQNFLHHFILSFPQKIH